MKLNHLNLAVPDVAATAAFFERFFGMRITESKGDNLLTVLTDGEGFFLILSNFEKQMAVTYPRDFHVGFLLDRKAVVDEIYQKMKAAGVDVPAPRTMHSGWGFYVKAPGEVNVEVTAYEVGG